MNLNLNDKNVIVSASSKGIGKATAKLFLQEGADVFVLSSNEENLKETMEELSYFGSGTLSGTKCDINNYDEIKAAVKKAREDIGEISVLVNNCGGPTPGYFETLTEDDWNYAYGQVLMSAVRFTREVLPDMKKNNWGRIINITSLSVKQPVDNLLLSNTFRSALTAFSKTLSNQVGEHGITVNNVGPGFTLTDRLHQLADVQAKAKGITPDEVFKEMAGNVPLKRLGSAEEIAGYIVFLASEIGGYITGITTQIDGGVTKATY